MFFDWTYLLIIPGLILGLWAQFKVKNTYAEYSRIPTRLGRSAASVVDDLLRRSIPLMEEVVALVTAEDKETQA